MFIRWGSNSLQAQLAKKKQEEREDAERKAKEKYVLPIRPNRDPFPTDCDPCLFTVPEYRSCEPQRNRLRAGRVGILYKYTPVKSLFHCLAFTLLPLTHPHSHPLTYVDLCFLPLSQDFHQQGGELGNELVFVVKVYFACEAALKPFYKDA